MFGKLGKNWHIFHDAMVRTLGSFNALTANKDSI